MSDFVIEMPETIVRHETSPTETVTYAICMEGDRDPRVRSDKWDFIRGMEAASSSHPDDRVQVSWEANGRIGGVALLTDADPEYYNHHQIYGAIFTSIPKRYELGTYRFDSMEFLDGYRFYCGLIGMQFDLNIRQLMMTEPIPMEVEV